MSEVYLVQHLTLGRPFALKILAKLSELPEEQAQFAEQFQLEAKLLAALDHPGLTRVVDLFHDDLTSYLVMELVEGITLTKMVADSLSPLNQDFVKGLAEQALDVLEYLHNADPPVIVRDIKPDNLMITSEGRLKLIDFGLAKRLVSGGKTETIVRGMGTDCYAPMEQYGEGVTDQRTDLYSLGATLYFTLTGEAPTPVWKRASTQEPLPNPRELNPSVSDDFWEGIKSLMEVDLKSRPTGVAQARQVLGLSPPPPGGERRPTRPLVVAHGTDHRLGSAEEFFPFQPGDWILKVMQAATVAQAREVRVTQMRSTCKVSLKIPAHGLPDAGVVLEALSGDASPSFPWLAELACGLKMVGEFRDFRLVMENWRKAWRVDCRGGKLEASPVNPDDKPGLSLEVDYVGKGVDRARQAADEAVELTRRTRLCPFPLYLDDRRLEMERPVERPLIRGQAREIYLASVSIPRDGQVQLQRQDSTRESLVGEEALAEFRPGDGRPTESHLDIRAYLEPNLTSTSLLAGFSYLPQPVRLLWYRHGVLCGQQQLNIEQSLEVLAHMDGSHMPASASGLSVSPTEYMFPLKLRPFVTLEKVLPVLKSELQAYKPGKPTTATSVGKAAAGVFGAPLLVLLFGAAAGPVVMKSALAAGLLQKAAALGGVAGYLHYDRDEELLRNICVKAVDAYGRKER